ncbi:3'-5' exonuclease [Butyrivibrio sp. AC2005]|uniref:3'-5' exonuclease n=1 Tax=Butyrivibrio sp. AC2005 TaxID=1280672 RepID=UPI0004138798|nr:3'-5' exonuclease [Butyrivibrio sp. AC2005]
MSWYATKKASKLPMMDKSRILVFDVETTGLSDVLDEILQITILDGYGTELFSSYIKPERHRIWPEAEIINGIKWEMVKDAPSFESVKKQIQGLFNNADLIVGYNVGFDISFVEAAGIIVGGKRFDVMTAFASYRAGIDHSFYRKCKLIECAEYFGYCFNAHDSNEDARATLYCFDALIADERFTTYKKRDKEQVQTEITEKKKTKVTFEVGGRLFSSLFVSLVMAIFGIIALMVLSGIIPKSISDLEALCAFCKNNLLKNIKIPVAILIFAAGTIGSIIRIFRMIIRLPRRIIVQVQRLFFR